MIGYLRGRIKNLKPNSGIIDVNGVGYNVCITLNTYDEISNLDEVELLIHTIVKEDSITLYGFRGLKEKEMFELLISVNGIGPKTAINILSGVKVEELKNNIFNSDIAALSKFSGIGKKTAERIVLELKNKIDLIYEEGDNLKLTVKSEAIQALVSLGYNRLTADKAVKEVLSLDQNISVENLIRKTLGILNK